MEAIRLMREEEEAKIKSLAKSSFSFLHGSLVKTTEDTYVYELSEEIVGVVVLETFTFKRNRLGGVVKWLFTEQKARDRGVASALIEHSVKKLQELGCDEMFTTVEGYNTNSSNRFADQGFMPLSAMQQIRRYGFSLLKIGPKTFHTIDIGHFL
ncbi:GNAT family N-acetyltransferase [Natroniella sp. ANB-PHB2]|uniref:GNAT family N-acetyltransferase n=1 Tax=Natroniella sp. ANB-PHB2 TaxID=3384444 RepID=UPI0038D41ED7